jgi:hypothetical protein
MAQEKVAFTRPAADRIAKVVRRVEQGDRAAKPLEFRRISTSLPQGQMFRVCTFTGSWSKNQAKVVTFLNVTTTPNTVSATNLFVDLASCSTTGTATTTKCAIARDGATWYVIAAECC